MKSTCFDCDSTAVGIQYSSIGGIVIMKFTYFYCSVTAVGMQCSIYKSGTGFNKYDLHSCCTAMLLCKYSPTKVCFVIFKFVLAIISINCTIGSNNCTTNESITQTTILMVKHGTFSAIGYKNAADNLHCSINQFQCHSTILLIFKPSIINSSIICLT